MNLKQEVEAMLAKIETREGIVDGRAELIMALEWVLGGGVSTSMSLESVVEGEDEESDDEQEYDTCTCIGQHDGSCALSDNGDRK